MFAIIAALMWCNSIRCPADENGIVRVSNSTIRLPSRIPVQGYALVDALPGIWFKDPVALASPPGETNRLFVVERSGAIYVITNLARPEKSLFLDLSHWIDAKSPIAGLLGLEFHPGVATNRFFFVFGTVTTSTSGAQNSYHDVLARFEVSPENPNTAQFGSRRIIFAQYDDHDLHNGGALAFGPDGYLYVSVGERVYRDPNSQDQAPIDRDLQGSILRIDVDGRPGNLPPNPHPASTTNYWIPVDNPFVGATQFHGRAVSPAEVRTELFATGFRNPLGMAFDSTTGDLYVVDVGEAVQEEVDLVVAGGDYGWPYLEGLRNSGYAPPPQFSPRPPLHVYSHGWNGGTNGDCVIGGVVYRGDEIPLLQGRFVFADFRSGYVWALHRQNGVATVEHLLNTTMGLTALGKDPRSGGVLAVHYFDGTVLRLVYVPAEDATNVPRTLADTGLFADLSTLTPNAGIIPYDINVPFWSDHATKQRWFCLPETSMTIGFNPTGAWTFPTGGVWIKHFELQLTNGQAESARRLETRVLVNSEEGFYGLTYRWDDSGTNAALVADHGHDERFVIWDDQGNILREQTWRYPSRAECMNCHSKWGDRVLGFNTAQLNREVAHGAGQTNQLHALASAGYFDRLPPDPEELPALAKANDLTAPLEFRARSYFQANCAACHAPGAHGFVPWDARITTPLAEAEIVSDGGVIKPGSLRESRLYHRLLGDTRLMPPIATTVRNFDAIELVANWITNIPPAPWSYASFGEVVHPGGSILSNGVFYVGGTGRSIQSNPDEFQFIHRPFDYPTAQVIARLTSQSLGDPQAVAGLMLRDSVGTAAPFVMVGMRGDGMVFTAGRPVADVIPVLDVFGPAILPQWLRLVRRGNDIRGFRSDDRINWVELGSASIVSDSLHAGLAVNSGSRTRFNNALFDNLSSLAISLASSAPAVMQQPSHIPLHASVENSGRALARVEFYDGTNQIGETVSAPHSITLSNALSGAHQFTARAVDEAGAVLVSQPLTILVQPLPALAAVLWQDVTHAGNWPGLYGADGCVIVNHKTNLPPAVTISISDAVSHTWAATTDDTRALATAQDAGGRIAAAWIASTTFLLSIVLPETELYRLGLYFLDWDTPNERVQTVEFIDPTTQAVLNVHTISNFSAGVWLVAAVRGNVAVRLTGLVGPGPVLSGVFLDKLSNAPPAVNLTSPVHGQLINLPADLEMEAAVSDTDGAVGRTEFYLDGVLVGVARQIPFKVTLTNLLVGTHTAVARAYDSLGSFSESVPIVFEAALPRTAAIFLGEDVTTRGDWSQRYGTEGFLLPPLTNWWPTGFPYDVTGSPWLEFGLSADYLEVRDQFVRAWPFMYSYSNVVYDLNLSDGQSRRVALYFFDDRNYEQNLAVLDALTGQILDSRVVTNGLSGRYLVWNARGHLLLRLTNPIPGSQPRVCGLFLDPFTNALPQVELVQPAGPLDVDTPATILVAAAAQAPDGMDRVEFHTAKGKLGEVSDPPYEFLWAFPIGGTHRVFARAVSRSGGAQDSQEVIVNVRFATAAKARFVGTDFQTGGDWRGVYGREGYWLPGTQKFSNFPPSVSVVSTQLWTDYGNPGLARALRRPDGIGRIFSFWYGEMLQFPISLNDGRSHRVSVYNYAGGWTNPASITVRARDSDQMLDVREITNQASGTYLTWDIEGGVDLQVSTAPGALAFINAIFADPNPDRYFDWQGQYFTPAERVNVTISGPAADPDTDGYDNWAEFLLGRDPRTRDPQPPLWLERESDALFLHVLVSGTADSDDIAVESSLDLKSWTSQAPVELANLRQREQQIERLYKLIVQLESPRMLFFRLRFEPAPPP